MKIAGKQLKGIYRIVKAYFWYFLSVTGEAMDTSIEK